MKSKSYFKIAALLVAAAAAAACSESTLDTVEEDTSLPTDTVVREWNMSPLHTEGRYLVNEAGKAVNLHGFAQTPSPYYNEGAWADYDVEACLTYNRGMIDKVLSAGWRMDFVRQHMDPYWCSDASSEAETYLHFNFDDFKRYFEEVYLPMAKYANERGLYVVMRPPGVCPDEITIEDAYQQYLLEVWDYVSSHPDVKGNPGIMFELANEPVNIEGTDGSMGSSTDAQFAAMSEFLQPIVDEIRANGADNIIWLPGLGYQSQFSGFATHPVEGDNLGLAAHCYPGWYGSDALSDSGEGLYDGTNGGYASFQKGWDQQIGAAADQYPLMVTEMDWSNGTLYPGYTWGQGVTGTAGGTGFGANFKYITDNAGNVSFLVFTGQEHLAQCDGSEPREDEAYTFYNDPENSCLYTAWHWYETYAEKKEGTDHGDVTALSLSINGTALNEGDTLTLKTGGDAYVAVYATYSDGTEQIVAREDSLRLTSENEEVIAVTEWNHLTTLMDGMTTVSVSCAGVETWVNVEVTSFPLDGLNPYIWGDGNTYSTVTHTLVTDTYGFGGWEYSNGLDLSAYSYLVVEFCKGTNVTGGVDFRLFDQDSYWTDPASYTVNDYRMVIDLRHMRTDAGVSVNPSHLYIIGFWTYGGESNKVVLNRVYASKTMPTDTYTPPEELEEPVEPQYVLDLDALDKDIYNPNGTASYDLTSHTLVTDTYGFGGWEFNPALDLSEYQYLVLQLGDGSNTVGGAQIRLFDQESYWSEPASYPITSQTMVVNLQTMTTDDGTTVDPSHIYRIGFWSFGGEENEVVLKKVYATDTYPGQ
ncbi:MAG: glycoside hydrolase family 5 protein [Prevotellaceae bacterium]|nr:glycoside hydrolase family 5 protein [Prevotellaceae bacterium]